MGDSNTINENIHSSPFSSVSHESHRAGDDLLILLMREMNGANGTNDILSVSHKTYRNRNLSIIDVVCLFLWKTNECLEKVPKWSFVASTYYFSRVFYR